jgi:methionine synthase / methylenetetrahydrofolate reductase(NADPH)
LPDIFKDRPWLLFDGAMGTYYAEITRSAAAKCETANLNAPEVVARIHREYIKAGAGAIKTNTFAANTAVLGCTLEETLKVVERGWEIANEEAAGCVLVFADIGPIPEGDADAAPQYKAILEKFISLGARYFLFETFAGVERVLEGAAAIKERVADAFVVASFAVHPDGHTRMGISGAEIGRAMNASSFVDAWGFNCVSGPLYLNDYLKTMDRAGKPLSVMPNAGYPALQDGRTVYLHNAEYFAEQMAGIHALGVKILGGCCGTTPAHIACTAEALRRGPREQGAAGERGGRLFAMPRTPNLFWEKLSSGKKVIAVEADPPPDADVQPLLDGVAVLRDAGADVITMADSPLARARADSSMVSALIRRRCGVEAMPHLACRDRNLNAMKALLLGLHIEGIRNVLAVTGDPVPAADRSEVRGVFDFNSQMLAGYIRDLNLSLFPGDGLRIGAALNINAQNLDVEFKRAEKKISQGVEYFLTQPVFGERAVEAVKAASERLGSRILAGILPIASWRNALFMNNEAPGIKIPDEIVERFRDLKRAEAEKLGIEIALETAHALASYADGYYILTPLKRYAMVAELVRRIRSELID